MVYQWNTSLEKYFSFFLKVDVTWMQHQCRCDLNKKSRLFLEKSLRMCLKLRTYLIYFSEHFFGEGILFEIFLERQNNISYTSISSSLCYFGDEIGQLSSKEAGLELMMKSIFIWRFELSLEIAIFSILFPSLSTESLEDFFYYFFLNIWRDSAVHLSVNCHITGSGAVTWKVHPVATKLRNIVCLVWVNLLAKLCMGTSCSCSVNLTLLSISCGYKQWNWWDHQFALTAAGFRKFPVHGKFLKMSGLDPNQTKIIQ